MVQILTQCNYNVPWALKEWIRTYPKRHVPNYRAMLNVAQCLRNCDQVTLPKKKKKCYNLKKRNLVALDENILKHFATNPNTSIRSAVRQLDVPYRYIRGLLDDYHEIERSAYCKSTARASSPIRNIEVNKPARVKFCNWFLAEEGNILWTGRTVIKKPCKFTNKVFKINVWASIIDNTLIGPIVMENLALESYYTFLKETLPILLDDLTLAQTKKFYFHYDARVSKSMFSYLNETFGDNWINQDGPIVLPANSSDLNPLEFFLWNHVKKLVDRDDTITKKSSLIKKIFYIFHKLNNDTVTLSKVQEQIRKRAHLCVKCDGDYFKIKSVC